MLQLPSSTSSFHGLLSELERPLRVGEANEKQTRKNKHVTSLIRANGSMFDVSAWTETVVDCTRAFYPYHNHFARSAKVYRMQQTYANMSKDGNKTCIVILIVRISCILYTKIQILWDDRLCWSLDALWLPNISWSSITTFVSFKLLIIGVFYVHTRLSSVTTATLGLRGCDMWPVSCTAQDKRRNWFGTLWPIHGEVGGLMLYESDNVENVLVGPMKWHESSFTKPFPEVWFKEKQKVLKKNKDVWKGSCFWTLGWDWGSVPESSQWRDGRRVPSSWKLLGSFSIRPFRDVLIRFYSRVFPFSHKLDTKTSQSEELKSCMHKRLHPSSLQHSFVR